MQRPSPAQRRTAGAVADALQELLFFVRGSEENSRNEAAGRSRAARTPDEIAADAKRLKVAATKALRAMAAYHDAAMQGDLLIDRKAA